MTPPEIVAARERRPLAFVPLGPIEWHGPHLPLGTDAIHAGHIARQLARDLGGVVLPTFFIGTETVRLPGTGPEELGVLGLDVPVREELELIGDRGHIVVHDPWHGLEPAIELRRDETTEMIAVEAVDSYRLELENLSDAVRGNADPLLGRADAVAQARVMEALFRSATP